MKHHFFIASFIFSLILLAGCGPQTVPPATNPAPTATSVPATPAGATDGAANAADADATPATVAERSLLAWMVEGAASPGAQGASNPGQLVLIDRDGAMTPIMDIPAQTRSVRPCTTSPTSPNGSVFIFYAGLAEGTLYSMQGTSTPVEVDTVSEVTCLGEGSLQFSPGSTRMGYIDYEPGVGSDAFITGTLKVNDLTSGGALIEEQRVAAFALADERTAYVSFFQDDQGRIDEAAIQVNEGGNDREVATLRPDEGCEYISASLRFLPDARLTLVLGQRCPGAATSWQFFTVDPAENSATRGASETTNGGYQSFARTNVQWVTPGGDDVLFTAPDGFTANTGVLYRIDVAEMEPTVIIEQQIVLPSSTSPENAVPVRSPDSRWLALVETTPNNENTLRIYDLSDTSLAPITVEGGGRGDVISVMAFTHDSSTLYAVSGGAGGTSNALIAVNLANGTDTRLERGRYNNTLAVHPDGSVLAIGNTVTVEDENEPPYLNLVLIDTSTGTETVLLEGANVVEGQVENQRFAVPLAWR